MRLILAARLATYTPARMRAGGEGQLWANIGVGFVFREFISCY